jgi:hypothetical protein
VAIAVQPAYAIPQRAQHRALVGGEIFQVQPPRAARGQGFERAGLAAAGGAAERIRVPRRRRSKRGVAVKILRGSMSGAPGPQ